MLNIPEEIKELYREDGIYKNVRIVVSDSDYNDLTNDNIEINSLKITESTCSGDTIKLGLFEASVFECTIHAPITYQLQDKTVVVYNEIDCSTLGQEYCENNCVYREDIGKYVYPVIMGTFVIDSVEYGDYETQKLIGYSPYREVSANFSPTFLANLNHPFVYIADVNDFQNINTSEFQEFVKRTDNMSSLTITDLVGCNMRTTKGAYSGTGLSFASSYYDYRIDANNILRYEFYYYDTDSHISNNPSFDANEGTSLNLVPYRYNAVFDYDKSLRLNQAYALKKEIIDTIGSSSSVNALMTDAFISKLVNPRYSMSGYPFVKTNARTGYDGWTKADFYNHTQYRVRTDEVYEYPGCDFYIYNHCYKNYFMNLFVTTLSNSRTNLYAGHYRESNVLDGDNVICSDGRMYAPYRIEYIQNGQVKKAIDLSYTRRSIQRISISDSSIISMNYQGVTTSSFKGYYEPIGFDITYRTYYYPIRKFTNDFKSELKDYVNDYYEFHGKLLKTDRYGIPSIIEFDNSTELYPREDLYPQETLYPYEASNSLYPTYYNDVKYKIKNNVKYGRVSTTYRNTSGVQAFAYVDIVPDYAQHPSLYLEYNISNNKYISDGTFTPASINAVLVNIANVLKRLAYTPATVNAVGMPYLEAGDLLKIYTKTNVFETYVLNRTISGEQHLVDDISSDNG